MSGKLKLIEVGSIIFFIVLIILGCNLIIERLGEIVGEEIQPFFSAVFLEDKVLIDFSAREYQLDMEIAGEINGYIQNSLVNVELGLASRVDYLQYIWQQGLAKFGEDLNTLQDFLKSKR